MELLDMSTEDFKGLLAAVDTENLVCTDIVSENGLIFKKTKILKHKNEKFQLPAQETFFTSDLWKVPNLMILKEELNGTKSLLDDFQSDKWHAHTRMMNPMSAVIKNIRSSYSHEFCSVAWCKLFEILSCHRAIPQVLVEAAKQIGSITIDSVHLCEAPGAFISATNHYLKTNYSSVRWNWLATTLNPYYEGNDCSEALTQDNVILSTLSNWTFLGDHTGNIMTVANLRSLEDKVNDTLRNVQLVTADGSIDCADAPDEQEAVTSNLHFCEIMAAMSVLGKGGTFVLKLFTFFEANTVCKLYLLSCFFQEVEVVKPAMSKEGNSEVYLVCRGFLGPQYMWKERNYLLCLVDSLPSDKAMFLLEDIPRIFLNRVIQTSLFYAMEQMIVIVRNVKAFPFAQDSSNFYRIMADSKAKLAHKWLQLTQIKQLHPDDFIINTAYMKKRYVFKDAPRASAICTDSFKDRALKNQNQKNPMYILSLLQHLDELKKEFLQIDERSDSCLILFQALKELRLQWGEPVEYIKCSRFCEDRIIKVEKMLRRFVHKSDLNEKLASSAVQYKLPCSCSQDLVEARICEPTPKNESELVSHNSTKFICYNLARLPRSCFVSYNGCFSDFTFKLIAEIEQLKEGHNIYLCSLPLLTRVQCGVVMLISAVFESSIFIHNFNSSHIGILFQSFRGTCKYQLWPEVKLALSTVSAEGHVSSTANLMEVVPITLLCQKRYYDRFVQYNNILLLKHIQNELEYFRKLSSSTISGVSDLDI